MTHTSNVQIFCRRATGSGCNVLLGILWGLAERGVLPAWLAIAVLPPIGLALVWSALRRKRAPCPSVRADFELSSSWLLAVCALIGLFSGLRGPWAGTLYPAFALVSAFARPLASVLSWAFLAGILGLASYTHEGLRSALPLASCIGALGIVSRWCVGSLLERARQEARQGFDRELVRLRDEARSYRLSSGQAEAQGNSGRVSTDPGEPVISEDPRLLRSSLEEIHEALRSCLSVCRKALGCRSVAFLWLDPLGSFLELRAVSSSEADILPGPFSAREGLLGAALDGDRLMELIEPSLALPLPYYVERRPTGHVGALPLFERGSARGVLAFDRNQPRPLDPQELELLDETAALVRRSIANERVFVQLERAKVEQGKLYRAVERLNEARTEAQVHEACMASARDFAAFQFAAVTVLRASGEQEICAVSGEGSDELVGKTFRDPTGLCGMVVDNRHPLPYRGHCVAEVQVLFTRQLRAPCLPSLLVLPLLVHQEVLGTLVLGSEQSGGFGADVRITLQVLAGHVAVSLANARMLKRLEELATTDGLTGLLNKRAVTEMARQKLRSAQRFRKPLAVLICDLDHFKKVNDTHGHDVGDRVIQGFADVLRRAKRETDAVGRFGGEEFVLICEQTDQEGAELLSQRIRSELGKARFVSHSGSLEVTCSVGIATFPEAGSDWESLFKATDEALYVSKRSGRNRVTLWSARLKAKAG